MVSILLLSRDTLQDERDVLVRQGATVSYRTWANITAPVESFPEIARWMMDTSDITFQLSFMEELARGGTRVINTPGAVQQCDKASIYFLWNRYLKDKIEMPPTIMTSNVASAHEFIMVHGQVVRKPVDGQGGAGIEIIEAKDTRRLKRLDEHQGTLFLQALIPSTHEIRTIVVGSEVIAQYARYNLGGLHSLGSGALLLPIHDKGVGLPADIARDLGGIALAARAVTGLDMLALDALIDAKQQPWLLEWNPFFAYANTKELGFTIASRIADFILGIDNNKYLERYNK